MERHDFDLDPQRWATLRQLLDEGLALEPAQRATWLEGLAAPLADFKPRLRDLLLATPGTAHRLLDTLPRVETADFAPPRREAAPERIGPYKLLRELGSGGMASVWLAERTDMLQGRQVALKLPHGEWGAYGARVASRRTDLAERMAREREILATLNHPNIASLFDAGVAEDGQPYLALEYVEGERIDAYCTHHALDVPGRLRLFLQAARAVAHAHANLVVHRDLKPSNILVNAQGEVRLLDFGIAKLLDQGVAAETELTQQSGRALTPDYAAPEQILGQPIGTAADVYALGVVLFELLAGSRPYQLKRNSRAALEEAIMQAEPARPSTVVIEPKLRKRLRGDLDTIVLKALKKQPSGRYSSVEALAEDIERHLDQRPVRAQPDSRAYRLRKFVARNTLTVGATTGVLIAIVGGASLAVWQAQVASAQREAALREKERAEDVKAFVLTIFREAGPYRQSGKVLSSIELLKLAKERIDRFDPKRVELRVELLGTLGESLLMLDDAGTAEAVLKQAIGEARAGLGAAHKMTLWASSMLSQSYRRQGRSKDVRGILEEIVPVLRQRQAELPSQFLAALVNLANLSQAEYRFDDCWQAVEEGLRLVEQRFAGRHTNKILLLSLRAALLARRGETTGALQAADDNHRLALDLYKNDTRHAMVLFARMSQANALAAAARLDEATREYDEVLSDTERAFEGRTRDYGLRLSVAAPVFLQSGAITKALLMVDESVRILSKYQSAESPILANAQVSRGQALLAARRGLEAADALSIGLASAERVFDADHEWPRALRHDHALALAYTGRTDAALAALARSAPPSVGFDLGLALEAAVHRAAVLRLAGRAADAAAEVQRFEAEAASGRYPLTAVQRHRLALERALGQIELGQLRQAADALSAAVPVNPFDAPLTPDDADHRIGLARLALAQGDARQAVVLAQGADAFWRGLAPDSRWAGEAALWLGRCQAALGRDGDARLAYGRAARALARSPLPGDAKLVQLAQSYSAAAKR